MFAGIFFLLIGVTKFSMQWNAIIEAMNAQAPTASGENENNGPAETFDEGSRNTDDVDLGPFIVLCKSLNSHRKMHEKHMTQN